MKPIRKALTLAALCLAASLHVPLAAAENSNAESSRLEGLEWRMVGPYRGGRVTTATGVRGKPVQGRPGGCGVH